MVLKHFIIKGLPIFTIHGNHDDPTRETANDPWLSPLDLMAAGSLVNYFGQRDSADNIEVFIISAYF